MKTDNKSILLFVIAIVVLVIVGKIALDMYHGGKFEWKHKDGHTKIKYEGAEHGE